MIIKEIIGILAILTILICLNCYCNNSFKNQINEVLRPSKYVTLVIAIPETHADALRTAMAEAGAGKFGNYSHCSYSQKGIGRFKPEHGANPYIGNQGKLEEVIEERIEIVCPLDILEQVCNAIKKAHPYEELVIDIFPIYEIGLKK